MERDWLFERLKDKPHYCEVRSPLGISRREWAWGRADQVAGELAKIYQEPNLRRILGGDIKALIYSKNPRTYLLNADGTASIVEPAIKKPK